MQPKKTKIKSSFCVLETRDWRWFPATQASGGTSDAGAEMVRILHSRFDIWLQDSSKRLRRNKVRKNVACRASDRKDGSRTGVFWVVPRLSLFTVPRTHPREIFLHSLLPSPRDARGRSERSLMRTVAANRPRRCRTAHSHGGTMMCSYGSVLFAVVKIGRQPLVGAGKVFRQDSGLGNHG